MPATPCKVTTEQLHCKTMYFYFAIYIGCQTPLVYRLRYHLRHRLWWGARPLSCTISGTSGAPSAVGCQTPLVYRLWYHLLHRLWWGARPLWCTVSGDTCCTVCGRVPDPSGVPSLAHLRHRLWWGARPLS